MKPHPIEPTQVALAGEQLPSAAAPPWKPPPPPPPRRPAWWSAPPPAGPPADAPVVHHYVHVVLPGPVPLPPEPRFEWSRLWSWLRTRHWVGAAAALAPVFMGQSLATGWGAQLRDARTNAGIGGAWVIALAVTTIAVTAARRRPTWYASALVTTALFGTAAMASPFDLVTFVTGVTR